MPFDTPPSEYSPNRSTAGLSAWQLLHIESDDVETMRLRLALREALPDGSAVEHAASLEAGLELLDERLFDAVLLGIEDTSSRSLHAIKEFVGEVDDVPVIVLTPEEDSRAAVAIGRCGADSILSKADLTAERLCGALRQALERNDYEGELPERRIEARYPLAAAGVVYPIEADGSPGTEMPATTVDIGESGIGLLVQQDSELIPEICVIGVECPDGIYRYATVEWRYRRLALPALRLGGRFLRRADDLLSAAKLIPRFDAKNYSFKPSIHARALQEWVARGVLRPVLIDRVKVCPECESLPTFREGCPDCGSALVERGRLIHHFACAHVAPAKEFERGSLTCPKCLAKHLVVGADFEHLDGPLECLDCDWSDSQSALIGECLRCGKRFPAEAAVEKEVYEYHVDRLDPLALLDRA